LVLDDFFNCEEFLKSSEAMSMNAGEPSLIPAAHQLNQSSPFVDSGVHLDLLVRSSSIILGQQQLYQPQATTTDFDDEVFLQENSDVLTSSSSIDESSSSSNATIVTDQNPASTNGLCRSRRSHFSRKESSPDMSSKTKTESKFVQL